jgi:hypothetical protein
MATKAGVEFLICMIKKFLKNECINLRVKSTADEIVRDELLQQSYQCPETGLKVTKDHVKERHKTDELETCRSDNYYRRCVEGPLNNLPGWISGKCRHSNGTSNLRE